MKVFITRLAPFQTTPLVIKNRMLSYQNATSMTYHPSIWTCYFSRQRILNQQYRKKFSGTILCISTTQHHNHHKQQLPSKLVQSPSIKIKNSNYIVMERRQFIATSTTFQNQLLRCYRSMRVIPTTTKQTVRITRNLSNSSTSNNNEKMETSNMSPIQEQENQAKENNNNLCKKHDDTSEEKQKHQVQMMRDRMMGSNGSSTSNGNTDTSLRKENGFGWDCLWKDGIIPWELGKSTPVLLSEIQNMKPISSSFQTILIPGCGSGYDLISLAQYYVSTTTTSNSATNMNKKHDQTEVQQQPQLSSKIRIVGLDISLTSLNVAKDTINREIENRTKKIKQRKQRQYEEEEQQQKQQPRTTTSPTKIQIELYHGDFFASPLDWNQIYSIEWIEENYLGVDQQKLNIIEASNHKQEQEQQQQQRQQQLQHVSSTSTEAGGAPEKYDFIFDYLFFCAIPPSLRPAWGKQIATLLGMQKDKESNTVSIKTSTITTKQCKEDVTNDQDYIYSSQNIATTTNRKKDDENKYRHTTSSISSSTTENITRTSGGGHLLTLMFPYKERDLKIENEQQKKQDQQQQQQERKLKAPKGPPYPVCLQDYQEVLQDQGIQLLIQQKSEYNNEENGNHKESSLVLLQPPYESPMTVPQRRGQEFVTWWNVE